MDYDQTRGLLISLLGADISDFLILFYSADVLDYFSMPPTVQQRVETQHCKIIYNSDIDMSSEWGMFGKKHGLHDNPSFVNRYLKKWEKCDLKHRKNDLPAVEWGDGSKFWYVRGISHRHNSNDPHFIQTSGSMCWYDENGKMHRDDGLPAYMYIQNGEHIIWEWWHHGLKIKSKHLKYN